MAKKMANRVTGNSKKTTIYDICFCAIFAALITVGAYLKIPTPTVPVSMQYTFTMLAGMLLGPKLGALSCFIYMALGLIGVPVFTGGGGPSYVFAPSFGYIIGFIFGAFVTGFIAHKVETPSFKRLLVSGFAGLLVCYAFGMLYFYLIMTFYMGKTITAGYVFVNLFLIFLPGDGVFCILGSLLSKRLIPEIKKLG